MSWESNRAARSVQADNPRSSISRYCYGCYPGVTALRLREGLTPPADREAWRHTHTPSLIREHLNGRIPDAQQRNSVISNLQYLYQLRFFADYITVDVDAKVAKEAGEVASFINKVVA